MEISVIYSDVCLFLSMRTLPEKIKDLEVNAQSDFHAHGAVVGKIVERHFVVNGRFERDVAVEEEGIAHFAGKR